MSRFDMDYDSDGPNTIGLWRHATKQALAGRKGLAVLREVEAALLALEKPRLIDGYIADADGEVCAVGAWAKAKIQQGEVLKQYTGSCKEFTTLDELKTAEDWFGDANDTAEFGAANGMGKCIAWALAYQNDEPAAAMTPEQRFTHVLGWVRKQISENPHAQAEQPAEAGQ